MEEDLCFFASSKTLRYTKTKKTELALYRNPRNNVEEEEEENLKVMDLGIEAIIAKMLRLEHWENWRYALVRHW